MNRQRMPVICQDITAMLTIFTENNINLKSRQHLAFTITDPETKLLSSPVALAGRQCHLPGDVRNVIDHRASWRENYKPTGPTQK